MRKHAMILIMMYHRLIGGKDFLIVCQFFVASLSAGSQNRLAIDLTELAVIYG
jgi:hypothetical protein